MVEVRQATLEEAGLIADLSRSTFLDTFAKDNTAEDMDIFMNEQFTRESLIQQVLDDKDIFLLAFLNGQTVGYARITDRSEPRTEEIFKNKSYIELARIYVIQSAKRKGVGSALLNKSLKIAKNLKHDIIWLGVWEKNPDAIQFYKAFGFQEFNKHKFLLGNDPQTDLLLHKYL